MANICMSFVSMETVNVAAKRLAVSFFAVNHGRLGRSFSGRRIPVSGNRIYCRHGIPEHVVQNARGMKPGPDAGGFIGRGLCRKMGIPPPVSSFKITHDQIGKVYFFAVVAGFGLAGGLIDQLRDFPV